MAGYGEGGCLAASSQRPLQQWLSAQGSGQGGEQEPFKRLFNRKGVEMGNTTPNLSFLPGGGVTPDDAQASLLVLLSGVIPDWHGNLGCWESNLSHGM